MPDDQSIVIIAGKHPIIAKKAKQFELFPGATELSPISQMNYESATSETVVSDYEVKQQEYEKYILEKREKREAMMKEIEEEKEALKEQEEEDITNEAAAFFFDEDKEVDA